MLAQLQPFLTCTHFEAGTTTGNPSSSSDQPSKIQHLKPSRLFSSAVHRTDLCMYQAEIWPRSFSKIQEIIGYPMATKLPKLFSSRGLVPRTGVLLRPSSTANSSDAGISERREITSIFISMGHETSSNDHECTLV